MKKELELKRLEIEKINQFKEEEEKRKILEEEKKISNIINDLIMKKGINID